MNHPSPTDLYIRTIDGAGARYSGSPSGLRAVRHFAGERPAFVEAIVNSGLPGTGVLFTLEELTDLAPPARPTLIWWQKVREHFDGRSR